MSADASLRLAQRFGDQLGLARSAARAGKCVVRRWRGYGNGYGYGDGDGDGDGDGNGNGKGECVQTEDLIQTGSPVVVRSYVSGVVVGRIRAGGLGSVALTDWRWLRRWEGVGGEGSVYDLVRSSVVPIRRGPLTADVAVFQQADVMQIDEETYKRLAL